MSSTVSLEERTMELRSAARALRRGYHRHYYRLVYARWCTLLRDVPVFTLPAQSGLVHGRVFDHFVVSLYLSDHQSASARWISHDLFDVNVLRIIGALVGEELAQPPLPSAARRAQKQKQKRLKAAKQKRLRQQQQRQEEEEHRRKHRRRQSTGALPPTRRRARHRRDWSLDRPVTLQRSRSAESAAVYERPFERVQRVRSGSGVSAASASAFVAPYNRELRRTASGRLVDGAPEIGGGSGPQSVRGLDHDEEEEEDDDEEEEESKVVDDGNDITLDIQVDEAVVVQGDPGVLLSISSSDDDEVVLQWSSSDEEEEEEQEVHIDPVEEDMKQIQRDRENYTCLTRLHYLVRLRREIAHVHEIKAVLKLHEEAVSQRRAEAAAAAAPANNDEDDEMKQPDESSDEDTYMPDDLLKERMDTSDTQWIQDAVRHKVRCALCWASMFESCCGSWLHFMSLVLLVAVAATVAFGTEFESWCSSDVAPGRQQLPIDCCANSSCSTPYIVYNRQEQECLVSFRESFVGGDDGNQHVPLGTSGQVLLLTLYSVMVVVLICSPCFLCHIAGYRRGQSRPPCTCETFDCFAKSNPRVPADCCLCYCHACCWFCPPLVKRGLVWTWVVLTSLFALGVSLAVLSMPLWLTATTYLWDQQVDNLKDEARCETDECTRPMQDIIDEGDCHYSYALSLSFMVVAAAGVHLLLALWRFLHLHARLRHYASIPLPGLVGWHKAHRHVSWLVDVEPNPVQRERRKSIDLLRSSASSIELARARSGSRSVRRRQSLTEFKWT